MKGWKHKYREFCNILIAARKERKITQTNLAKRLGKRQNFISKYETGERRLDVVELLIIGRALEIDPIEIIRKLGP